MATHYGSTVPRVPGSVGRPSKFIRQFTAAAFQPTKSVTRKSVTLYIPEDLFNDITKVHKVMQMSRQEFILAMVTEGWEQFTKTLKPEERKALGL